MNSAKVGQLDERGEQVQKRILRQTREAGAAGAVGGENLDGDVDGDQSRSSKDRRRTRARTSVAMGWAGQLTRVAPINLPAATPPSGRRLRPPPCSCTSSRSPEMDFVMWAGLAFC
jgi:hypothetical protein